MAEQDSTAPPSPPDTPVVLDPVERRKRELRGSIHALTGSIIDHKAAGRWASAKADAKLVAELRSELASLSTNDVLGPPGTGTGTVGGP